MIGICGGEGGKKNGRTAGGPASLDAIRHPLRLLGRKTKKTKKNGGNARAGKKKKMPHCHGVGGGGNRSDTLQRTRAERRCDRGETRYKSSGRAVELGARVNESSIATSSTGFTDALTRSGGQIEAPANTTAALNAAFQKVFEPQVKWRNEKEAAAREAAGGASGFSLFFCLVWLSSFFFSPAGRPF